MTDVNAGDASVREYGEPGSTFIQWKGTSVCMDLFCLCGEHLHIDADFAYAVRCHACQRVLLLGTRVAVAEDNGDYAGVVVPSVMFDAMAEDAAESGRVQPLPLYGTCEGCGGVLRLLVGPDPTTRWEHYPSGLTICTPPVSAPVRLPSAKESEVPRG